MNNFQKMFKSENPLIGMIHLPPLPDYDGSPGIDAVIKSALNDLRILEELSFDGALIENEYDQPHRVKATQETIDAMILVTKAVVNARKNCKIGVEILLNDPKASLDVAKTANADFIRTDYFVDPMTRPGYGEFDIDPEGLIKYRKDTGSEHILIMADIQVKYATMLIDRTIAQSAKLAEQHHADAIIISGDATGDAPVINDLDQSKAATEIPVIIGSGFDAENGQMLLNHCDGAIVGTALMKDKVVNTEKSRKLLTALGRLQ
ncbi:BtpA/SgcQ family protein [Pseudemcibacter aquimaris]|uniref:BtpA/SgcQ family protein n=1 Tax=Pseudemcibacter aquimaris TaxID=2857064 RepID=UPI002010E1C2|nr:BtpA/SgcQ family protein [Pseudemcibacter aquimaris]MCC3860323.1 BtpA/SgcQ family protein [Pseudemcibacter aquimaris]WDU57649.1 BtpA/SgcQ family protein [Pseudemcibacter aquimaris]